MNYALLIMNYLVSLPQIFKEYALKRRKNAGFWAVS